VEAVEQPHRVRWREPDESRNERNLSSSAVLERALARLRRRPSKEMPSGQRPEEVYGQDSADCHEVAHFGLRFFDHHVNLDRASRFRAANVRGLMIRAETVELFDL
jgi:hypothetical protein